MNALELAEQREQGYRGLRMAEEKRLSEFLSLAQKENVESFAKKDPFFKEGGGWVDADDPPVSGFRPTEDMANTGDVRHSFIEERRHQSITMSAFIRDAAKVVDSLKKVEALRNMVAGFDWKTGCMGMANDLPELLRFVERSLYVAEHRIRNHRANAREVAIKENALYIALMRDKMVYGRWAAESRHIPQESWNTMRGAPYKVKQVKGARTVVFALGGAA